MKALASLAMIGLLMGGCAAIDSPDRARARTVMLCDTYDRTLTTLAVYKQKGRLTADQISKVDTARPFLNAACDENAEPIGPATLDTMETMLLDMVAVQTEVAK